MGTLTIPNTFSSGQTTSSTTMNANFAEVASVVNNLDNANLSASAAIANSKLANPKALYPIVVHLGQISTTSETAFAFITMNNSATLLEVSACTSGDTNGGNNLQVHVDKSATIGGTYATVLGSDPIVIGANGAPVQEIDAPGVTAIADNDVFRISANVDATETFEGLTVTLWLKREHLA